MQPLPIFMPELDPRRTQVKQTRLIAIFVRRRRAMRLGRFHIAGRRMNGLLVPRKMRDWLAERPGLPDWLGWRNLSACRESGRNISLLMEDDGERRAVRRLSGWAD